MIETSSPPRPEPAIDENARRILEARYLVRSPQGSILETPAGMFWRVARAIAEPERAYGHDSLARAREFYAALASLEFLPNSPTLMNAGREVGQLSACFVLPVEDSIDAIFETLKHAAKIQRTGGGTGFSFSRLRPRGDLVATTGGKASGPISFIRVYNAATDAIHQGGVRRGANMAILRVDHPDILEFIDVKSNPSELQNFNVSVAVTDAFMTAVREGKDYDLLSPRTREPAGKLSARAVFDRIVERAWQSGEPGVVFIDRVNAANPTPLQGEMESTNPCAELPLLPYESCNLGSVNLGKLVARGKRDLDWDRFASLIRLSVRFLDDVIDANRYPLPSIEAVTKANRKIGLGVMGFADALVLLGIPYDSNEALELGERIAAFLEEHARAASRELARERGPFPAWRGSLWDTRGDPPQRNATVTTIAPTGTIALIAGCSSGIEPLFAVSYVRRALDGEAMLTVVHPELLAVARTRGFYSSALEARVASTGTLAQVGEAPEDVRRVFRTAHEIAPEWHVRMQAVFQRHGDNSISKTINLPENATSEDVKLAYLLAYDLGCKGITVYRYGSRKGQVLSLAGDGEKAKEHVHVAAHDGTCGPVCPACGYSECAL